MFSNLRYSIKQAFIQIGRNSGMSVASIFSITAMMLILGVFFMLTVNINLMTESIKDQFDSIEVFLYDNVNNQETGVLMKSMESMDEVDSVEFVSKDAAMESFKVRFGTNAYLLDSLTSNPLPNAIRVHLASLEDGDFVAELCKNMDGVEDVRYYQSEVNKVINFSNMIQKGAFIIIAFLIVVSEVVVSNTVKLTVMARQEEIAIMKYVGATNWFIRGPLLSEGVIIGIISALVSVVISGFVYFEFVQKFSVQLALMVSMQLVDVYYMIESLLWIFIALGVSIGAFGSIVSMRRFLKA